MNLLFFKAASTGLPLWSKPSSDTGQPHIVQLSALLVDSETQGILQTMDQIVKPGDWGIPQKTVEVHGITNGKAEAEGIEEADALDAFLLMWNKNLRICHNTTFETRMIRIATTRYFSKAVQDDWKSGEHLATAVLAKPYVKMPLASGKGYKMPTLKEAYSHFNDKEIILPATIEHVYACMNVYFAIQDEIANA